MAKSRRGTNEVTGPGRDPPSDLNLHISRGGLRRVLVSIAVGLTFASFIAQLLRYPLDAPRVYGLVPLFDGDEEGNIPTFFSSFMWVACAALLCVRASAARGAAERYARHWMVLAAIFFLAGLDETAQFHELANRRIASAVGVDVDTLPWVPVAAVLVLALLVAYRGFVRDLSRPVRRRAILGGMLLISGALGLEVVEAVSASADTETGDFVDGLVSTVQELLEMVGVILVIDAMVLELSSGWDSIRFRFR